jgi:Fe-S oxidoreductase/nitrate reductase gamma subunit
VGSGAAATREVFGNIAPWMRILFYGLVFSSLGIAFWQVWARGRHWRQGTPGGAEGDPRVWLRRLLVYALGQKRVPNGRAGGRLHLLLFSGFTVLAIGTTLLFIAEFGPVHFHRGAYYLVYELTMDLFGVALIAGCALALYRRLAARPASLGHRGSDYWLLGLLLLIGCTGFLVEALRLRWDGTPPIVARWSPVGWAIARALPSSMAGHIARLGHVWTWWLHVGLILAFFATFARTRLLHAITGSANIMLRPTRAAGALPTVSMETVEETGRIGASSLTDFTRQELLSLDACMECGRCEDACPAFASQKPLSPKAVVLDLRLAMGGLGFPGSPHDLPTGNRDDGLIAPETLWACTMCQACVFECPVLIGHVDLIAGMRRYLVGEGRLSGPPAQALRRLAGQGNPHGQPPGERLAWADGLDVPTTSENPTFEVLLWVGCAASFDPRAQKVARATAQLLRRAGVNFAVLGSDERCTGDPARRIGEEFLFQERARENIAALKAAKARRIVTPCPHCLNTLRNEYSEFGGEFEVMHHSQFLAELARAGRVRAQHPTPDTQHPTPNTEVVTLHDPCYLARVNGETDAPRELIRLAGSNLKEMPRHGRKTFCCGAGGGRIWFEEAPEQRVNRLRATEAIATGAQTLVTACPFCLNMMADGMAGAPGGEAVRLLDVAELLLESTGGGAE